MPGVPEGVGAFWNSYVIVEDADATVEKAGARVAQSPWRPRHDGPGTHGDAHGSLRAAFGLWQPAAHQGPNCSTRQVC